VLVLIAAFAIAISTLPAGADPTGATSTMPSFQKGLLVDQGGRTLYVFSKDTPGTSSCYGDRATLWPPLLAPTEAKASGNFSINARTDGAMQWAYKNQPLYLFSHDTAPGQENGNGFEGLYSVVKESKS
jgi:predicted lipoprotein with Yx(FWY)xxD motif